MKISRKLMIIVLLTLFEISLSLWSVFEIAKGARFHQLNFLHLKYNVEFSEQVNNIENELAIDIPLLKRNINNIKRQPVNCLEQVNRLNILMMKHIGTVHALELCEKDIRDVDQALDAIDKYVLGEIDRSGLVAALRISVIVFNENSVLFEKPITQTVSFIMRTMIPLVIFISFFNILFITYLSRNISGSINNVIAVLTKKSNKNSLDIDISRNGSGELKTLLNIAEKRLKDESIVSELNEKLESLVKQRTSSLTRANEELAQFAYRASHDLKAPLTSTKSLAQLVKQDIRAGQLHSAENDLDKIISQMIKLEELVVGILALTEADAIDEEGDDVDFQSILAEIRASNFELLAENGCTFEHDISITQPMKTQKARVVQILDNLVTNAIKYCDSNKKQPFVKACVSEKQDSYVVKVEDNGLGIPQSRLGEVFQMFKRFHPNVSFGSGLGLAIVKKHVDHMQGSIDMVTSVEGTTFTIVFPKEKLA